MNCIDISFIECNLSCLQEAYNFFEQLPYGKYIVRFRFGHVEYGLLEKHHDSVGSTVITLNGRMLHEYFNDCKIEGYRPIKIND